jgi:hypothetical protein
VKGSTMFRSCSRTYRADVETMTRVTFMTPASEA